MLRNIGLVQPVLLAEVVELNGIQQVIDLIPELCPETESVTVERRYVALNADSLRVCVLLLFFAGTFAFSVEFITFVISLAE